VAVACCAGFLAFAHHRSRDSGYLYFSERHVTAEPSVKNPLNPLADVKSRLLARYPSPSASDLAPLDKKTADIKNAIYNAFLTNDLQAISATTKQISYERKPESITYVLRDGIPHASYNDFNVHGVIDSLDTTVLLTAYLFDRLKLYDSARKYYSAYSDALKDLLIPGLDDRWRSISRRQAVTGMKLRLSLGSSAAPLSREYLSASYLDTRIEMFLVQTLTEQVFRQYRRQQIIYPAAAKKRLEGRFSETHFSPDRILTVMSSATTNEQKIATFEYCIFVGRLGTDDNDRCAKAKIESLFGPRGFASAMLKYKDLVHFVRNFRTARSYDLKLDYAMGGSVISDSAKNKELAKLDIATFETKLASLRESMDDSTYNLTDDVLYLAYRFFDQVHEQKRALDSLCQIARFRTSGFDHVILADFLLKRKAHACGT